jgi:hypothetical protein
MKKKLFSHPDVILAVLALILFGVLVAFYFWATDAIVTQVHRSLIAVAPESASGFNLKGASALDLRGLLGQASSSPASSTPTSVIPTPSSTTPTVPAVQ